MGAAFAAIGALFTAGGGAGVAAGAGAAAGAAAGGLSVAGSIGLTIAGGLASGLGMAKMEEARYERQEADRIAEENRRSASYEGAGGAVRFWEDQNAQNQDPESSALVDQSYHHADPNAGANLPLGQRAQKPLPGQQYRQAAMAQPVGGVRYNRETGMIERG